MKELTINGHRLSTSGETVTDPYARTLLVSDALREPILLAAMRALCLSAGSRGLDTGCGIGLQALRLAETVGPQGNVTGYDASASFVALAQNLAQQAGLSQRVSFQQGDWNALPYDDAAFDWAWSADAVGYAGGEVLQQIRQLARVVKPGGSVAILMWSSQMLLPGYPALEARLNATRAGVAPFAEDAPAESHYLRTLGLLRATGLHETRAETFVHSVYAPLEDDVREALADLLQMRWGGAETELPERDGSMYRRLCQPHSPEFILNRPDYYAFFTYSLFHGIVV